MTNARKRNYTMGIDNKSKPEAEGDESEGNTSPRRIYELTPIVGRDVIRNNHITTVTDDFSTETLFIWVGIVCTPVLLTSIILMMLAWKRWKGRTRVRFAMDRSTPNTTEGIRSAPTSALETWV